MIKLDKFHQKKTQIWGKGDMVRLYVARDAYDQAGYIDLKTGELVASRPGTYSELEKVMQFIQKL